MERPASTPRTPQTTTEIVERILAQDEPDPVALAFALGYQPAAIAKLRDKHGDHLLRYLRKVWKQRQEQPRFLAKQQGRVAGPTATDDGQYVDDRLRAIDDLECVDDAALERFRREAQQKLAETRARLLIKVEAIQTVIETEIDGDPDFRKLAGRDLWLVRSKLDRIIRNVKREAA